MAATQLRALHGALTPNTLISDVFAIVQTGNIHAAVFDFNGDGLYVSYMQPENATVPGLPVNGYDRQYTRFSASGLFAEREA